MSKHLFKLFAPCLLVLFLCVPLNAQTATATLSGIVEDQNKAAIPGVAVTVENVATRIRRNVTSNDEGQFTVPLLPPGEYTVTFAREGFAQVQVNKVVLNVNDQKALAVELKIGDVKGEVVVTREADLINTSSAVTNTIDRQFVGNLPLNGRSFQSLILLTPGVVVTNSRASSPGQFSINGQRTNANYFTVDGVGANIGVSNSLEFGSQQMAGALPGLNALGATNSLVSVDALEEFKIQTSTYSAEFGRQPGGQVQIVTRSGGNKFHGSLFEYVRNEAFDANNWFNNANGIKRPPLRQNQFGGTFSGPIMLPRFGEGGAPYWSGKNSTYFFLSYEGLRVLLPRTLNIKVPSLRIRQVAAAAYQPLLNAFPLPTGPETTTSAGIPTGAAPFVAVSSDPKAMDATSIRVDHTFNSKLTLFGRYNESPSSDLVQGTVLGGVKYKTRTFTLGSTALFSSRSGNDFRFNYSSNQGRNTTALTTFGGAVPVDLSQLVSGFSGPGKKQGLFGFFPPGGGSSIALGDQVDSFQRQINIVDNVFVDKGSHGFRFGFDFRRLSPIYGPVAYAQTVAVFGVGIENDLRNGIASNVAIQAKQGSRPIFDNLSLYIQDSWKPSRRLTLDLGLRWDLNPAPHDANGLRPVLVTGITGTDVRAATLASPDTPFYKTFYGAFAPRAGVAYLLSQSTGKETVIRGGFGVYYDLGNGQATAAFEGFPFSASKSQPRVPFPIPANIASPPSFSQVQLPLEVDLFALNPSLQLPYTLQWNVGLEQSLGGSQTVSLSYVASAGRKLLTTQILNLNSFADIDTPIPRPNPNFGAIYLTDNGPTSDYKSLQAQFQRRLSRGLQALVNYTWSHANDEVSDEATSGVLLRGNADFDVRHNFSAAVTYSFPTFKSGRILTSLFRGWSIDSTIYSQSGRPFSSINAGFMIDGSGRGVMILPDVVPGQPFWVRDPSVAGGQRLNGAAFQSPPPVPGFPPYSRLTRQGNLPRNVIRLPGMYQVNMGLRRQFTVRERLTLQLRAEAFNLFNHPMFANHDANVAAPDFGVPSTTLSSASGLGGLSSLYQLGGQRSIQFSLRLSF